MGNGVGHPNAVFAILLEGPWSAEERGDAGGKGKGLAFEKLVGAVLAVMLAEFRLVVEQIENGRGAGQMDIDDRFGLGGLGRLLGSQRIVSLRSGPGGVRAHQ